MYLLCIWFFIINNQMVSDLVPFVSDLCTWFISNFNNIFLQFSIVRSTVILWISKQKVIQVFIMVNFPILILNKTSIQSRTYPISPELVGRILPDSAGFRRISPSSGVGGDLYMQKVFNYKLPY